MIGSNNTPPGSIARSLRQSPALLTLACLFASASSAGEDAPFNLSLTPGMRVRILAPDISTSTVIGTIRTVNRESVTIDAPGRAEPVSVLREKITRLEVSVGLRSRWTDAAIGALIGGAGLALACSSANRPKNSIVGDREVTGTCALVGLAVGTLVGAAMPPGERWDAIPATRYRVGFAPRLDHGLNLAVAWRF